VRLQPPESPSHAPVLTALPQFRRSMKGEKDSRPHHISIPPKDAIAIVPPKKVSPQHATPHHLPERAGPHRARRREEKERGGME
jgi:hypothetical protein